jgi:cytochrome b561
MPERPLLERYSGVAVALHWLVAIGIVYNLFEALVVFDDNTPRSAIDLHKSIGITVIGLVVLRVLWKLGHPAPAPLPSLKPWERKLSVSTHHLLYLMMAFVPVAGWLHDSAWKGAASHPLTLYGVIPWFRIPLFGGLNDAGKDWWHNVLGEVHGWSGDILAGLIALHLAGALKHQFLDKQPQFRRMWFGK